MECDWLYDVGDFDQEEGFERHDENEGSASGDNLEFPQMVRQ